MPATLSKRDANAAYHADTDSLSHSMLKVFRESASLFYGRYVAKTIPSPKPSASMELGTCVHALLFNEDPSDEFVKGLDCQRRSNADKEKWAEFEAQHAGKIVLDTKDYDKAHAMAASLCFNDTITQLLRADGPVEEATYWNCNEHRCKLDKFVHGPDSRPFCILDLKTCDDPSPAGFQRAMARFGYHTQAAWYSSGIFAATRAIVPFYFIVVGSSEPYDSAIYGVSDEAIGIGRDINHRTVERIKICRESGDWRNEWSKDIRIIDLPRWAQQEYIGD